MKKYYVSFRSYGLISVILPVIFILNGILVLTSENDYGGFMGKVKLYTNIMWVIMGLVFIVQAYRIFTKRVYLGINEQNIIYKFTRKGITFDYSDAEFYTAKQSGNSFVIRYKSLNNGKKKVIPLNMFNSDPTEFFKLLKMHSHKDIFIKKYGEELKLFEIE